MASQNYALAIAQLAIFAILTPVALFVLYLHGRRGLVAWVFLLISLALQLTGQSLIIGAGSESTSKTGLIITQVGLSPLLFSADGVIREIVEDSKLSTSLIFGRVSSVIFHLVVIAAATLLGVGASSAYSPDASSGAESQAQAGAILFLLCWLSVAIRTAMVFSQYNRHRDFRALLFGLSLSLPWLLVRTLYSILAFFLTSTTAFNPIIGNFAIKVVMQALPVLLVTLMLLTGGIWSFRSVKRSEM